MANKFGKQLKELAPEVNRIGNTLDSVNRTGKYSTHNKLIASRLLRKKHLKVQGENITLTSSGKKMLKVMKRMKLFRK